MRIVSRLAVFLGKFVFAFAAMSILCAILWGAFVDDVLYHCTDDVAGYFTPDGFVHDYAGTTVQVVKKINVNDTNSDTIKEGWTRKRLWYLWFSFLGTSLIVSALLGRLRWMPRRWREL